MVAPKRIATSAEDWTDRIIGGVMAAHRSLAYRRFFAPQQVQVPQVNWP